MIDIVTDPAYVSKAEKWAQYLNEDLETYFTDVGQQLEYAMAHAFTIHPLNVNVSLFGTSPRLVDADERMVVAYTPNGGWRAVLLGEDSSH